MRLVFATATLLLGAVTAHSQTIYPIDRAEILNGAKFDFKVEFPGKLTPDQVKVTVNGTDYAAVLGRTATFIEREDNKEQSSIVLRDVTLTRPGSYRVQASDGTNNREMTWTVYDTGPRAAKNVILFIGDGMSPAHRVAARHLSKGIVEG